MRSTSSCWATMDMATATARGDAVDMIMGMTMDMDMSMRVTGMSMGTADIPMITDMGMQVTASINALNLPASAYTSHQGFEGGLFSKS